MTTMDKSGGAEPSPPAATRRTRPLIRWAPPILAVAMIVCVPAAAPYVKQHIESMNLQRRLADEARRRQTELSLIKTEKENFLELQANPILRAAARRNREAVARAKSTLERSIDRYRSGIEPFISDLRSWSTEFGIIAKSISGWWYKDGRFDHFMEDKFAAHLFTDRSIANDVADARRQLREDIEASQNQLLAELTTASTSVEMRMPPAWPDSVEFSRDVSTRARAFVGHSEAMYEIGANATGVLVPVVVDVALRAAANTLVTRAGSAVLAEAGTVAAGAGEGGAAGSEAPVIGNVIGFGVGLFASYLAMSYEQAREDDSLRRNISKYIETLKTAIIGDDNAPSDIIRGMYEYVDQVDDAERRIITRDVLALNDGTAK